MPASPAAAPRRALFLHGAGAWGGQWAIWQRVFEAAGWRCAAPDLQPAAEGLAATRLDDYAAQALGAFERLRNDPVGQGDVAPVIVGASLGGLLALAAAARLAERPHAARPLQPSALVLVNPLPPAPWAAALPAFATAGDGVPWHSQGRFQSTARALPQASFADREFAFRHWRDESAAVLREARAGIPLPAPSIPLLLIASEGDADIPPAVSAALAEGLRASLMRLPGGHVDPVMGASAASAARVALAWLEAALSAR
jgi:pimeloyl-ACP methyl ester carboxylesterase